MQVEREYRSLLLGSSGRRVSNAWAIYLRVGNTFPKGMLIPHNIIETLVLVIKDRDRGNLACCLERSSRQIS